MSQLPSAAPPELLLQLPHDFLVDVVWRLELRDVRRLAAFCRLLRYGQTNPIKDALWLRPELKGWTIPRPLQAETRGTVHFLLRLAWQDGLEFHCIAAPPETLMSLFVNTRDGKLLSCGVEGQYGP
jgi:hypothetical protein